MPVTCFQHNQKYSSSSYHSETREAPVAMYIGQAVSLGGFIKSTDHRPTDHWPTDHQPLINGPPTHRPNNNRPNQQDSISNTWSMKNIHFTERKHSWDDVKL